MPATDSMLRQTFPKLVIAPHPSDEALSLGPSNGFGKSTLWPRFPCSRFHGRSPIAQLPHRPRRPYSVRQSCWPKAKSLAGTRALGNRSARAGQPFILMDPSGPHGARSDKRTARVRSDKKTRTQA